MDHRPLVDEFRSVSDARGVLWRGLVQAARQLGALVVLLERGCRGGHLRIRVVYDECQDGGAIPIIGALGACAHLVAQVSFVAFVQLYLHAGRRWLAWSIYSLRTVVLILNFIFPVSINFRAITDIHHFSWAGEMISVPVGVPNLWGLISNFSLLLLLIFSVDATITVWRRGDRRRALLVGGSMIFGAILAWHVPLVIWGLVEVPFFLGFTHGDRFGDGL